MDELTQRFGIEHPIVQAPMGGGLTTPELVAEVCEAGALGSIAAAYLSPAEIDAEVARVRARTSRPFAINLFALGPAEPAPPEVVAQADARLDVFRRELGAPRTALSSIAAGSFEAQLEAVLRARPAVFSFTFGMPSREQLDALRARSIAIVGTATTVEEAAELEDAGVDAICAQGAEAGGHRGTFRGPVEAALIGTMTLVRQIVDRVRIPVLAAGGIMDGRGVAAALALGARGAQLGTAFLSCPEAGTPPAYREALRSPAAHRTVITRAFSGRAARAIANRLTEAFEGVEVPPFPVHQALTREIRAAATRAGRADLMQMLAGQGAPMSRAMPARALVSALVRETL